MNKSKMNTDNPTGYAVANDFINDYTQKVVELFGKNVVGVYLFGSLTYGDFNPESSDIDFMVLVNNPLTTSEIKQVEIVHKELENTHLEWRGRVESSYTPASMLGQVLPPKNPRPYYGEGKMWHEANYGNEWIINLYLLEKFGFTLYGTDIHKLVNEVDVVEVQKACIRDLFQEWEPKLREPEWLDHSHYQSYLVLNLCRILHAVIMADPRSKKVSAQWVKDMYSQWIQLVQTAEDWRYGTEMSMQSETLRFLEFTVATIKKHELYNTLS